MMVLLVVLITIWVIANLIAANAPDRINFLALLSIGAVLMTALFGGVIAYLTLTVKAVNLNRRQSNFIDAVTHELKSPIASLKLYLQTLDRCDVSETERADFQSFMLDDVARLDGLINHLLDVARVDRAADQKDAQATFRLDKMLRQCGSASCLRYGVDESCVRYRVEPYRVTGSEVQTEILFRNLTDNALKYGGDPPEVIVSTRPSGGGVSVSVEDNGSGIPPNQRRKVFGRFVRLGSELERSRQGTGLGLYLVRNITRAIGGSIRIHDREAGGTRFEVLLKDAVAVTDDASAINTAADDATVVEGTAISAMYLATPTADAADRSTAPRP